MLKVGRYQPQKIQSSNLKPQLIFFPLEWTNDGGIATILNLAMSRGRASTNQTFLAGETVQLLHMLQEATYRNLW